ncbi:branched-chain amino acid ABC transporter permease [Jatrophihabitans telluris]|uniref:Branched-chain amino acid ABC transporter permease n=1 Tax=Jatrophihabitans telluris TaxID=2038343 RepID=A0ABY4QV24_9ACTN|nr:branched-chain amino acid ABC transporter permease [Jatrophihabitans telluris]UQX86952.1 branched-chain amino acid ABC transporter permease [Jatrophihabitans telluris]
MVELVQTVIFGVLIGAVYALMATGLTLTFGVMKIVNMAQGAFLILSAYLCYSLWSRFGIDPILASFIVTIPLAGLGLVLYKLVIERVQRIDHGLTIVATFSLAIVAEAVIALIWGPNPTTTTPKYFNQSLHLGSFVVPRAQLYACVFALGVAVVLQLVVKRTWLGHAITAASENPEGARLIGVEPSTVGAWIFAIATASTAFGGAALSFLYQFTPDTQDIWIGLTLSVVILGGLGSIPGALAAGVLLGVAEATTSTYVSVRWAAAVPTLLILVVLLVRPQGLFTRATRQDVGT